MKDSVVGIRECPQEPASVDAVALLDRARAYRPYNALNDGALIQSLVALVEDLLIKLALAGPLYSARQLQPKLDEAYEALRPFAEASKRFDDATDRFNATRRPDDYSPVTNFTHGELRRARSVLENGAASLADATPGTRSYHAREQGQ